MCSDAGIGRGRSGPPHPGHRRLDHVSLQASAAWQLGGRLQWAGSLGPALGRGGLAESGGRFRVTGTGSFATAAGGGSIEQALIGTFAGLIVVIVLGACSSLPSTGGACRATLAASPRRGRVLAAKAIVIGSVTFAVGLAGAAASLRSARILRYNGVRLYPVSALTDLRVVAGTGRCSPSRASSPSASARWCGAAPRAVAAVIVAIVCRSFSRCPTSCPLAVEWLLRLTPAAGFAIQQPLPEFPQISGAYVPTRGYFPLTPWTGFAVLCGYAVIALILAGFLLRKRDA